MTAVEPTAAAAAPAASGRMSTETMVKVCSFVSLTYLALVLFFLGAIHAWGFFSEPPVKATRDIHGPVAGLFGTPVCALAFLVLAWLMRQWNRRRADDDKDLWNRFPVPLHAEIPVADPVGKAYRLLFFLLVFGVGAYAQGDLFKSFLQGNVHLDWPARTVKEPPPPPPPSPPKTTAAGTEGTAAQAVKDPTAEQDCRPFNPKKEELAKHDPQVWEFAHSNCGIVMDRPWDHFTHRFTWGNGNDYHFNQKSGLSYFPGFEPYLYLFLTTTMGVVWLVCVLPWLWALVKASPRLVPWFIGEMRPALAELTALAKRASRRPRLVEGNVAAATAAADGETGPSDASALSEPRRGPGDTD